jgi:polysaccharide pyruvyl transferase WcaK-like protein
MTSNSTEVRLTVLGAAVSANKGAASMVYGLLDGLAEADVSADVALLTTYPVADGEALTRAGGAIPGSITVATVDASPVRLLMAFAAAVPIRILDRFRLPLGPLSRVRLIREIRESDVTVDMAGISFADGRGIALLGYNTVMSLFPYLAGGSVVKASQAIGPAESFLTRAAARLVLPRMEAICARGAATRRHLDSLDLSNVVDAADIAFLMNSDWDGEDPVLLLSAIAPDDFPVIAILPSAVVDSYARTEGIDHIGVMAAVVDDLTAEGAAVIVAPHSYRTNGARGRMNDGPIVADIEKRSVGGAVFVDRDLDPRELRSIIRRADVVVTGRFHGMVSALEVGTPPVVIGWSHKYGEVLDQFGAGSQGIKVEDLSSEELLSLVRETLDARREIAASIEAATAMVHASAERNIAVILSAAADGGTDD